MRASSLGVYQITPARLDRRERLRHQRHVQPLEGRHRGRERDLRRQAASGATTRARWRRPAHRQRSRRLPDRRADRPRRDERRLPRRARPARPHRRAEAARRRRSARPTSASASCASRSSPRRSTIPSIVPVYDAGEEDGAALHRDGVRRRERPEDAARARRAGCRCGGRCGSSARSPRRSTPRTRAASSTAT